MLDRQVASPVGRQGMSAGDQRTCQLTEVSPTSGPIPCHSLSPRPHPRADRHTVDRTAWHFTRASRPTAPPSWLVSMLGTCAFIAKRNGVAQADLVEWNPVLGSECGGLVADFCIRTQYVCVGLTPRARTSRTSEAIGEPTSSSDPPPSTTTAAPPTSTAGGIW